MKTFTYFLSFIIVAFSNASNYSYLNKIKIHKKPRYTLSKEKYKAKAWTPIPFVIKEKIQGHSFLSIEQRPKIEEKSLNEEQLLEKKVTEKKLPMSVKDLAYLQISYKDFRGDVQIGELICHQLIAKKLLKIFHKMFKKDFRIANMSLIEDFNTDDTISMEANNSSCLCMRTITNKPWKWSNHSNGSAIDLNPLQNPYYKKGCPVEPKGSERYIDRSITDIGVISPEIIKIWENEGFIYGGKWSSLQDFMHFEYPLD